MSFADDIAAFARKAGSNADLVVRKVVLDVTRSIMEKSPVGDPTHWEGWNGGGVSGNEGHWLVKAGFVREGYVGGHFRANWQLSIGGLPSGEVDGVDPSGATTLAKAASRIPAHAAGHVYFFANNLPYAQALEEGHSKQAPNGMVALTEVEFHGYINAALGGLK